MDPGRLCVSAAVHRGAGEAVACRNLWMRLSSDWLISETSAEEGLLPLPACGSYLQHEAESVGGRRRARVYMGVSPALTVGWVVAPPLRGIHTFSLLRHQIKKRREKKGDK